MGIQALQMKPLQGLLQARKQASAFPLKSSSLARSRGLAGWQGMPSDSFVWGVQDFLSHPPGEEGYSGFLFLDPNAGERDTRYQGKRC